MQVSGNLGSDQSTRIVVPPSATGNRYAVTDQGGLCCDPALAHVFGGPDASVNATAIQFTNTDDNVFYRWTVTVPANATVVLMHFAVQRAVADTAAAEAQARALADLSDPNALVGMTQAERSQVVNYSVPPQ